MWGVSTVGVAHQAHSTKIAHGPCFHGRTLSLSHAHIKEPPIPYPMPHPLRRRLASVLGGSPPHPLLGSAFRGGPPSSSSRTLVQWASAWSRNIHSRVAGDSSGRLDCSFGSSCQAPLTRRMTSFGSRGTLSCNSRASWSFRSQSVGPRRSVPTNPS